jgi:protein phosphatase
MEIDSFGKSVQGKDHLENEDNFLINEKLRLFAVADGVSIPKGGREASSKTISYLKEFFEGDLKKAVEKANKIFVKEKMEECFEGYTTLTAAHFEGDTLKICNVGDSPAFLFDGEKIEMLTLLDAIPGTSSLTQAIGEEFINIHSNEIKIKKGDYVILATDGITNVLDEIEIVECIKKFKEPKDIIEEIIKKAEEKIKDYDDDKTVIVIRMR